MSRSAWKRAAVALAAVVVVTGVAGCEGGDGTKAGAAADPATQSTAEAAKAVGAAHRKTVAAKSAKVEMRIVVKTPDGAQGAGSSTFSGVQGWSPSVADLTVTDSTYLAGIPGAPARTRVITSGGTTYVDVGAEQAAQAGGKRWLKADLEGVGGDEELQQQLTLGLDSVKQDPAQELKLLAGSSKVKHLGEEKVNGVTAQHYGGELTAARSADVWIGTDGYPVRMVVKTEADGAMTTLSTNFTDYGTKAAVQAPPAADTFDFMQLLKGLKGLGQG